VAKGDAPTGGEVFLTKIRFNRTSFWVAIAVLAIGCAAIFTWLPMRDEKTILVLPPYQLTPRDLTHLRSESAKGNCAAAYAVAQYHFYVSSDMQEAEKYSRLAAKCPSAKTLAGLINVLQKPEHDAEVDEILVSLRKLDPDMGQAVTTEVEYRRAMRTSK
jgi:hypothetical protein